MKSFNKRSDEIQEAIKRELLLIGSSFRSTLIHRVQRGLDINNNPFVKYSEAYKEYKRAKGRPVEPVNLTFRFKMLRAIKVKNSGNSFELFFNSALENDKALAHNFGKGRLPKRQFWGISKKEQDEIIEKIQKVVKGEL